MFGRKKDEDYDDYNEKYAAKYDDDYIAPSKEYRSECDHSHEQSYSNINDVSECGHSHEQTYEDADSEQKPYDDRVSLESSMERLLAPNEHLLWTGGSIRAASSKNNNGSGVFAAGIVMFFIGGLLVWWISLLGMAVLCLGVCLMVRNSASAYAVTDIRVIVVRNGRNMSVPLAWINRVNGGDSSASSFLALSLDYPVNTYPGSKDKTRSLMMYRISDAPRVKRIINDAVMGARMRRE
ncbi:hypothetical protein [Ruminococcus flavefaciens]|uniref:hypothetical protein n=1 Tax=Ruminococcus flavefaciens TaxID=1265 RepID=UPI00048D14E5|nr:hypothetical protein [Ruminococcus flavefaciens]